MKCCEVTTSEKYIGDGVYIRFNGYHVIAETAGNTIFTMPRPAMRDTRCMPSLSERKIYYERKIHVETKL